MSSNTLADLLFEGDPSPDQPAVLGLDGPTISMAQLRARADTIAAALRSAGVKAGNAVAVMLPNGVDLVATLFAVWRVDGVYLPLNPRLTDTEIAHVMDTVHPIAAVTVDEHRHRVDHRAVVTIDDHGSAHVRALDGTAGPRHPSGTALIQFTSGTTGRPKPVLLRHDGVLKLLDGVIGTIRSPSGEPARAPMTNLIPVSLSLWAGIYQVLFAFRVGAPIVVMERFEPATFAALVRRFDVRSVVLPPAAMAMLCDDAAVTDLTPLRYVRSITAPLSPLGARRFRDQFGIAVLNGYGQTEIGGEIVGWSGADAKQFGDTKLGSVGRPHRGVSVRVAESGELEALTPALSAGYADGADLSDRLSTDGWFRTGDVGRVDDDGFVWIDGRVSDMINRGGLKVYPEEVAEVLRLSPAVADAAVVGIPDARLGEVPCAFIVPTRPGPAVPTADLDALARTHLAPYKVPVRFEMIDELPRNEVGKLLRGDLVARLTGAADDLV